MLWGRRAGGCKCRAANRLYVLSLTPGRRSKGKCCLDTQWEFLPPDKSVSLEGETTHYFFWGSSGCCVCGVLLWTELQGLQGQGLHQISVTNLSDNIRPPPVNIQFIPQYMNTIDPVLLISGVYTAAYIILQYINFCNANETNQNILHSLTLQTVKKMFWWKRTIYDPDMTMWLNTYHNFFVK